jgi:hypothetical protein
MNQSTKKILNLVHNIQTKDMIHLQQYMNLSPKNTMQITQIECKWNLHKT